jgi:heme oxygenase
VQGALPADEQGQLKPPKKIPGRLKNSARSVGLARMLKEGTRESHSLAEQGKFMTGFFKGITKRETFAEMVASLYFVYETMERAFDTVQHDERVKAIDFPELRRLPSLEEDMAYFFGENWRDTVTPSLATQQYCNRVEIIAQEQPYLLIAHMYTRYLGDLFGGQMIRAMARRTMQLDEGFGTRFYEFDDIPSVKDFIEQWYTRLNELSLSDEQKHLIVEEANLVFSLNIDVFAELAGRKRDVLQALLRLVEHGVKSKGGKVWGQLQLIR